MQGQTAVYAYFSIILIAEDKNSDSRLRGFVKLKKIQKSEKNSNWQDTTLRPQYQFFFFFFGNMYNNQKQHKKTKFQKNNKFELGLDPPSPLPSFSRIFDFFQLDKTPNHNLV